ncbi:MAG: hypothetical protein SGPRY_008670 [Prymnesium sp.]
MVVFAHGLMIRFSAVRQPGRECSLQEVQLFSPSSSDPLPVAAISNPQGQSPPFQRSSNLIDQDLTSARSKWVDVSMRFSGFSTLVFSFPSPTPLRAYAFWTANDNPGRDPTAWQIHLQMAEGAWRLASEHAGFPAPLARHACYGELPFTFSPDPPPPPVAAEIYSISAPQERIAPPPSPRLSQRPPPCLGRGSVPPQLPEKRHPIPASPPPSSRSHRIPEPALHNHRSHPASLAGEQHAPLTNQTGGALRSPGQSEGTGFHFVLFSCASLTLGLCALSLLSCRRVCAMLEYAVCGSLRAAYGSELRAHSSKAEAKSSRLLAPRKPSGLLFDGF